MSMPWLEPSRQIIKEQHSCGNVIFNNIPVVCFDIDRRAGSCEDTVLGFSPLQMRKIVMKIEMK